MARRRKNKNQKVILFAIIFLGISLFLFSYYHEEIINFFIDNKTINDKDENKKPNNNKDKDIDKEENKEPSNVYKKYKHYKKENLNRYNAYKTKNPKLTDEQVVTRVNMGLDYDFYGYIHDTDMSKDNLILVNKYLKLASDYEPDDLEEISDDCFINGNIYVRKMRKEAKEHFEQLSRDSIKNGTPVYGQSAYREYSRQEGLYNNAVKNMGVEAADDDTARPGHSEHQTGLTLDVSSTKAGNMMNFHNTESYKWMLDNAHKYGFILRYTKGYEDIHGFMYESWHFRYVGVKVATDMHDNYPGLTYDEYYYMFID